MKWLCCSLALALLASTGFTQENEGEKSPAASGLFDAGIANPVPSDNHPIPLGDGLHAQNPGSCLTGNHNFPNFIGYMSNPLFGIDPWALTKITPLNDIAWITASGRLPGGTIEIPGAILDVALSERLAVGLTQGGYAWADLHQEREGWLNLGGYAQYTLIQNVPDQFLLTAGLHWTAPMGSKDIFQGFGPAKLAPYVTAGKEFCDFHILSTFGYAFPAGESNPSTQFFYGIVHLDRRCFGWLYPLIELNWVAHTSTVDVNMDVREGIIDLGSFSGSGNLATLTFGANAVLVPEKLEFGAGYTTSIATQHDFHVNALIVKMTYRY